MLDLRSKLFFYSVTSKDIEEKLSFLRKALPQKATGKNYQLSKKLLKTDRKVTEDTLQSSLQHISDKMRAHLLIDRHIKILTVSNVEAGKFESIGDLYCIYINGSLKGQNYKQKIAILAHEISHFYLIYKHKIYLPTTNENELLTELNAIYTGFGLLLLNGYETYEKRKGNTILKSRVGYIELSAIKRTIIRTAYLRKQNPIWIIKNVGLTNMVHFTIELFDLIKDYYKAKKKKNTLSK